MSDGPGASPEFRKAEINSNVTNSNLYFNEGGVQKLRALTRGRVDDNNSNRFYLHGTDEVALEITQNEENKNWNMVVQRDGFGQGFTAGRFMGVVEDVAEDGSERTRFVFPRQKNSVGVIEITANEVKMSNRVIDENNLSEDDSRLLAAADEGTKLLRAEAAKRHLTQ